MEQASDLIDDLLSFIQASGGQVEDMPPYFLGSIVLIKKETLPESDVVDGQQRLTTLTILLAAIRASVTGPSSSEITRLIYEKGSTILGTRDRFRLTLRERDAQFFQTHIQKEDGLSNLDGNVEESTDSQKNIRKNALFFMQKLLEIPEADRIRLAQFMVTRCYLVVVATPDWATWFPSQDERDLWTHRLGNMALLTRKKNSSASNYDFDRKKQAYFAVGGVSPFVLTTQVLHKQEWTHSVVQQRQKELLELLVEHWRL